jgi:hypothetical protein
MANPEHGQRAARRPHAVLRIAAQKRDCRNPIRLYVKTQDNYCKLVSRKPYCH